LQKKISIALSLLFILLSALYLKNNLIPIDVYVEFEYLIKEPVYIEAHYTNKNNVSKRYNLFIKNEFKKVPILINKNNYKNLYFYFGEIDKKIKIKKIKVYNMTNSFILSGRKLFNSIKKSNKIIKRIKLRDNLIELTTPFTFVNSGINKRIKKLAEEKTIYYILLLPISILFFFFLNSIKFQRISKISNIRIKSITIFILFIPILYSLYSIFFNSDYKAEKSINKKKNDFRLSDLEYTLKNNIDEFNNNFFLRNKIISINNSMKIKFFNNSPINKVLLGKKGWLFYAVENEICNIIDYFRAVKPFDINQLRAWKERLESRYYWLKKRGIEYLFIIVPNKSTIYPEFLPNNIKMSNNKNRFDQLINYLYKMKSPVKILDMRKEFFKKKVQYKLYRLTDSHWSNYGAFFAYRMIMENLNNKKIKSFSTNLNYYNLEIKKKYLGGDLAKMLSLRNKYREDLILLKPKENIEIINNKLKNFKRPFVETTVKESKKGNIKNAIFVHDSFGYTLIPFLSQHFKRIIFIRDWNLEFYTELINKEKPVIVIEEMAERFFMNKINNKQ